MLTLAGWKPDSQYWVKRNIVLDSNIEKPIVVARDRKRGDLVCSCRKWIATQRRCDHIEFVESFELPQEVHLT